MQATNEGWQCQWPWVTLKISSTINGFSFVSQNSRMPYVSNYFCLELLETGVFRSCSLSYKVLPVEYDSRNNWRTLYDSEHELNTPVSSNSKKLSFLLKLRGKVYTYTYTCTSCVSCLIHGSETWLTKVEHEIKFKIRLTLKERQLDNLYHKQVMDQHHITVLQFHSTHMVFYSS